MKAFVLILVVLLTSEYGSCNRRRPGAAGGQRGGGGRGGRGRCAGQATHVHMHTGAHTHVDPVHQGTTGDTQINVHIQFDPHSSSLVPRHAPDGYIYAHVNVQPNSARAGSTVSGYIHIRQKVVPELGPVEVKLDLSGFNHASDGHDHGIHIHEFGDLSNGCQTTGSRFNPMGDSQGAHSHGSQGAAGPREFADWGIHECDADGLMQQEFNDDMGSLSEEKSFIGRAVVIHAHGSDEKLACGVIGFAGPHEWPGSASTHTGHSSHEHRGGHGHHGHDHHDHDHQG